MDKIKDLHELIEKADHIKKQEKMDLSSDQDLTVALMNLISIEEHLFFTGAKTGKTEYYDLINEVRQIRKQLLKKIVKEYEGEVWCISKHLLASSMRLIEVGTKQLNMGRSEQAYELFGQAYQLYALFWGINMKLLVGGTAEKSVTPAKQHEQIPVAPAAETANDPKGAVLENIQDKPKKRLMSVLGDFVQKIIDCCIE